MIEQNQYNEKSERLKLSNTTEKQQEQAERQVNTNDWR